MPNTLEAERRLRSAVSLCEKAERLVSGGGSHSGTDLFRIVEYAIIDIKAASESDPQAFINYKGQIVSLPVAEGRALKIEAETYSAPGMPQENVLRAIRAYESYLTREAQDVDSMVALAKCYLRVGNRPQHDKVLQRVFSIDQLNLEARMLRDAEPPPSPQRTGQEFSPFFAFISILFIIAMVVGGLYIQWKEGGGGKQQALRHYDSGVYGNSGRTR